jgi:hypothetical protein
MYDTLFRCSSFFAKEKAAISGSTDTASVILPSGFAEEEVGVLESGVEEDARSRVIERRGEEKQGASVSLTFLNGRKTNSSGEE